MMGRGLRGHGGVVRRLDCGEVCGEINAKVYIEDLSSLGVGDAGNIVVGILHFSSVTSSGISNFSSAS